MLITIPLGWHPHLDATILAEQLPVQPTRQCTIVRAEPRWTQTEHLEHRPYGTATRWAEAVWVAEFDRRSPPTRWRGTPPPGGPGVVGGCGSGCV